jgi:hypothetical protein
MTLRTEYAKRHLSSRCFVYFIGDSLYKIYEVLSKWLCGPRMAAPDLEELVVLVEEHVDVAALAAARDRKAILLQAALLSTDHPSLMKKSSMQETDFNPEPRYLAVPAALPRLVQRQEVAAVHLLGRLDALGHAVHGLDDLLVDEEELGPERAIMRSRYEVSYEGLHDEREYGLGQREAAPGPGLLVELVARPRAPHAGGEALLRAADGRRVVADGGGA